MPAYTERMQRIKDRMEIALICPVYDKVKLLG
jgi:hypothetical protein